MILGNFFKKTPQPPLTGGLKPSLILTGGLKPSLDERSPVKPNSDERPPVKGGWGVFLKTFTTTIFLLTATNSFAAKQIQEVNYFASLRANETNVRSGPGQNYPIKFTFKLRGLPVRVISEYDNWNEIEDYEGQSGWVTQSLLTKKRTLMVQTTKSFINMHSKPSEKSRIYFRLENNVIGDYLKCEDDWCAIKIESKKGWVQQADVFGSE